VQQKYVYFLIMAACESPAPQFGELVEVLREEFKQLSRQLRKDLQQDLQPIRRADLGASAVSSDDDLLPPLLPKRVGWASAKTTSGLLERPDAEREQQRTQRKEALKLVQPKIREMIEEGQEWGSAKCIRGHKNQELIRGMMGENGGTDMGPESSEVHLRHRGSFRFSSHALALHPPAQTGLAWTVSADLSVDGDVDSKLRDAATHIDSDTEKDEDEEKLDELDEANEGDAENDKKLNHRGSMAKKSLEAYSQKRKTKVVEQSQVQNAVKALGLMKQSRVSASAGFNSEDLDDQPIRRRLLGIISSTSFELATLVAIFANAVAIGAQTDYMARNTSQEEPLEARVFDVLFCLFFTVEILLKLAVFRCHFFWMWGWAWNVFDLSLVVMQLAEEIAYLVASSSSGLDGSLLRTLRILRAVRVVRVLRVMAFAENLQLLVSCILHSMSPFIWACALLILMIYIFSIYLTQIIISHILESDVSESGQNDLRTYFGSVPLSMLTLLAALLGGVDWIDAIRPIMEHVSVWLGCSVVLYIVFLLLAVLNVITGNFVQCSLDSAIEIKEMHRLNQARRMFISLDRNESGSISLEELCEHLQDPEVKDFFATLDIDISEATSLFELIDLDNSGIIDFEEFLSGCMRLHGPSKATDLLLVTRDFRNAFNQQGEAMATLEEHICHIKDALMPAGGDSLAMGSLAMGATLSMHKRAQAMPNITSKSCDSLIVGDSAAQSLPGSLLRVVDGTRTAEDPLD